MHLGILDVIIQNCLHSNHLNVSNLYMTHLTLLSGPLQYPLLYSSLTDESVHCHLFGLAQSVSSVHGLLVHCGVPVTVVEYHLSNNNVLCQNSPKVQGQCLSWRSSWFKSLSLLGFPKEFRFTWVLVPRNTVKLGFTVCIYFTSKHTFYW